MWFSMEETVPTHPAALAEVVVHPLVRRPMETMHQEEQVQARLPVVAMAVTGVMAPSAPVQTVPLLGVAEEGLNAAAASL